jgi:hypothetical protein
LNKYFCILLFIALLTYTGCGLVIFAGGAAAGVGGAFYISGALEKEFNVSSTKLWRAAQSTAKALKFTIQAKSEKEKKYALDCKDSDNHNIKFEVLPLTGDRSKIIIRVDTFGDEAYSRKILEAVEARL